MALIGLLMFTSAASFVVGMCTRKRHQLIRVHHQASSRPEAGPGPGPGAVLGGSLVAVAAPVTAITGPDGLIQPYVAGGLPEEVIARCKMQVPQGTATAIFRR